MLRFYSENMSKKLLTRASDYSTGLAGEGDRNIDKPTNNSMDAIPRRIFSAYESFVNGLCKYTNICMEKRLLYTHCTIVSQCIVSQGSNRHVLLIPREVEAQLNTPHQLSYFSSKINIGRRRHHHHHQPHHHRHHNLTYSHSKNSIPGSGIRPPTFQCVMLGCCNLTV